LIRLNHTFEHINDQYETLRKIHGLLKIDGICIIAMPVKTDAIWNRYGVNWVQIDAPRHYIIHTITSFRNLAERAGFKIIDITFNSTEFQFLGSEKYLNNISLHSVNSDKISFYRNIFSQKKLNWYRNEAKRLNSESQGDSAIFILKSL
jgi:predicted SAM-dependent methyltransferase